MSTSGRPDANAPAASDVAAQLREAEFVRLVAAADGDAIAGAGVLAGSLRAAGVPFQLTVTRPWDRADRTTDADLTVALGGPDVVADVDLAGGSEPASHTAYEVVRAIDGAEPDTLLALVGTVAAGGPAGTLAEVAGLERRPGIAVPTNDLADGLAHSTLVHGPFSGDTDRAAEELARIGLESEDADRRAASLLALSVLGEPEATPRAADAVERALRPYEGGPFETIGGYADVLDTLARERPGIAVALALGQDVHDAAIEGWRTHAERAHTAIRAATTGRYDGLFVARDDGDFPVGTVARLSRDFRSPEPVVLALTDDRAALAATDESGVDCVRLFRAAFEETVVAGTPQRATATVPVETADAIMAVREAIEG